MVTDPLFYRLFETNCEEVQAMQQIHDIRESRVYQEALEEGREEGREEGMALAVARMAAGKMGVEQIAAILKLDVERVRQILSTAGHK
jgi:predicted transposase YdaD